MTKLKTREAAMLACTVAVLAAIFWVAATPTERRSAAEDEAAVVSASAASYDRETIYHSPQTPGHTAWTGAWLMPDQTIVTAFTQATGPTDPAQRSRASSEALADAGLDAFGPSGDFSGLSLAVEYLRSTDGGETWQPFREDGFEALSPHPYTPQATIALDDGTMIRRVNGYDLKFDESVPDTAFLQRRAPGAREWSAPEVLLDPERFTYQISRIRRLRDGRLMALGQVWSTPAGSPQEALDAVSSRLLLMVSDDDGDTWAQALETPPGVELPRNEWDAAELRDGDLLAVIRTTDPADGDTQIRKQARLEQRGDGWVLTDLRDAPFPHSGHPELLATREGPILHIASTGTSYTTDEGETWRRLRFPRGVKYRSEYYPRAVQAEDGTIHVFAHVGGDDAYGETDQSIVLDRFRLVTRRR